MADDTQQRRWDKVDQLVSGLKTDVDHEVQVQRKAIPLVLYLESWVAGSGWRERTERETDLMAPAQGSRQRVVQLQRNGGGLSQKDVDWADVP